MSDIELRKLTAEEVKKGVDEGREEEINRRDEKYPDLRDSPFYLTEVYLYGKWIGDRLLDYGVEEKKAEDICMVLGAEMATVHVDKYADVAAFAWNKWVDREKE